MAYYNLNEELKKVRALKSKIEECIELASKLSGTEFNQIAADLDKSLHSCLQNEIALEDMRNT